MLSSVCYPDAFLSDTLPTIGRIRASRRLLLKVSARDQCLVIIALFTFPTARAFFSPMECNKVVFDTRTMQGNQVLDVLYEPAISLDRNVVIKQYLLTRLSCSMILLANSLRLLPLHAVERVGARMLRGSITKAAALWIRQQYLYPQEPSHSSIQVQGSF